MTEELRTLLEEYRWECVREHRRLTQRIEALDTLIAGAASSEQETCTRCKAIYIGQDMPNGLCNRCYEAETFLVSASWYGGFDNPYAEKAACRNCGSDDGVGHNGWCSDCNIANKSRNPS